MGLADVVPRLIAYRLLEPASSLTDAVQLECLEDHPDRLHAELALHTTSVSSSPS